MDDEDAFLAALTANPADDVCRLVFADWLEEREQFDKATYLRLVCRAVEVIGTPDEAGVIDQTLVASELLPWEWRNATAGRFVLELKGYDTAQKILVIKSLYHLREGGLAEAVAEAERVPNRVYAWATLEDIACAAELLREAQSIELNIECERAAAPTSKLPARRTNRRYDLTGSFPVRQPSDEVLAALTQFVHTFADTGAATDITQNNNSIDFVLCESRSLIHIARRLSTARAGAVRVLTERHRSWLRLSVQPLPIGVP